MVSIITPVEVNKNNGLIINTAFVYLNKLCTSVSPASVMREALYIPPLPVILLLRRLLLFS